MVNCSKLKKENIKYNLIDSGTYGCVINPPFYNKESIQKVILPYTQKESSDIAKIYKDGEKEFKDEYELLQRIQKIDPKNEFTTKMKGAMIIKGKNINDDISNCLTKDNEKKANKYYHQIILENGGVRTDKSYKLTYSSFLKKFKVFIRGMLKLQSKNFVHMDIKPANVLISSKKINLIDFGLMTTIDKLFTYDNRHALGYLEYPYYPPEFYMAYMYVKYGRISNTGLEKFFSQSILSKYNLYVNYYKGVYEFKNIIDSSISKGKDSVKDLFPPEIATKTDVFSIAYVISALNKNIQYDNDFSKYIQQKHFVNMIHTRCIDANPYSRISMKELYKMVSDEQAKSPKGSYKSPISVNSEDVIGGKVKMRKMQTNCDKVPKYMLRVNMNPKLKKLLRKSRE